MIDKNDYMEAMTKKNPFGTLKTAKLKTTIYSERFLQPIKLQIFLSTSQQKARTRPLQNTKGQNGAVPSLSGAGNTHITLLITKGKFSGFSFNCSEGIKKLIIFANLQNIFLIEQKLQVGCLNGAFSDTCYSLYT